MNKKVIFSVGSLFFLVVAVAAGLVLVRKNQDVREEASGSTSVYLDPTNQTIARGGTFEVVVRASSGANKITGVDVKLNYDPNVVEVVSVRKPGAIDNLDQALDTNNFDNTAGKLSYVFFTLDKTKAVSGQTIAILRVNARVKPNAPAGLSQLVFDQETEFSAVGETANAITNKTNGTVLVTGTSTTGPTSTATPTASATFSPTPTPRVTFTPTPTPVAPTTTPTPRPTATSTITATATASPRPTATAIAEILCLPQGLQTVKVNHEVNFHVFDTGRNPELIQWTAENGEPDEGTGLSFTTKFTDTGNYSIQVTDGGPTSSCSVKVIPVAGDVDRDGYVNIVDIGIAVDNFFADPLVDARADLNGDGNVDIVDIGIIIDNYEF